MVIRKKRRRYLIDVVICYTFIMLHAYFNFNRIEETYYYVPTNKEFTAEQDGKYKVALIADVHYGSAMNKDNLVEMVQEINEKNVDIVILCGDIVDEKCSQDDMRVVFDVLGDLRSKYGSFFVYGNHDSQALLRSDERSFTQAKLHSVIERNGITILRNEIYTINDELVIVGRDYDKRMDVETLMKNVDKSKFLMVLDHTPCDYKKLQAQKADLLLSGHTHNGQMFPLNLLLAIPAEDHFLYGSRQYGDLDAIITSGVGGWLVPFKNTAPAEYVIIDIQ